MFTQVHSIEQSNSESLKLDRENTYRDSTTRLTPPKIDVNEQSIYLLPHRKMSYRQGSLFKELKGNQIDENKSLKYAPAKVKPLVLSTGTTIRWGQSRGTGPLNDWIQNNPKVKILIQVFLMYIPSHRALYLHLKFFSILALFFFKYENKL